MQVVTINGKLNQLYLAFFCVSRSFHIRGTFRKFHHLRYSYLNATCTHTYNISFTDNIKPWSWSLNVLFHVHDNTFCEFTHNQQELSIVKFYFSILFTSAAGAEIQTIIAYYTYSSLLPQPGTVSLTRVAYTNSRGA